MSDNKKILLSRGIQTKMENANKQVKKNDDGSFDVVVGAVNHFNSMGEFYTAEGVREKFFKANSYLMERCKGGYLRIESEHPVFKTGMTQEEWFQRLYSFDKVRTAGVITELWLEELSIKEDGTDMNIILIWARIMPLTDRELGVTLQKDLENPNINTAFSIRSIIIKELVNLNTVCKIQDIITFDWVSSPGIKKANAFYTAGMESSLNLNIDNSISLANLNVKKDVDKLRYMLHAKSSGLENNSHLYNVLQNTLTENSNRNRILGW